MGAKAVETVMTESLTPTGPTPRVWVLTTKMVGDNHQLLALADALGWAYETRHLEFTGLNRYHFRIWGPSLHKVDRQASDALAAPWPDIVLATGRSSTPVALWIRKQSAGRSRIVYMGQAWVDIAKLDLFVANAQYYQPRAANTYHLALPLLFPDQGRIQAETRRWDSRLAHLPRPWTVLLVGGSTGPHVLNLAVARDLLTQARSSVERDGGSLIVSTSRRTPDAIADFLQQSMLPADLCYRWAPDGPENPYLALLGLGDRFVVTGESMSMLMEVARVGKPLMIFPLPERRRKLLKRSRTRLRNYLLSPTALARGGWRTYLGTRLVNIGWLSYRRDFSLVYDRQ
jgi:hypothetical protein